MQGRMRVIVAALTAMALPLGMMPPLVAETAGSGSLEGKVFAGEGGPVPGAVVLVRSLDGTGGRESGPAAEDGSYRLDGLPAGEYEVAVRTDKGLYLGARSLLVTEAAPQTYSFRIEDRPASEMAAMAEPDPEQGTGEQGEQPERKKSRGGVPPLGWNNPLVVLAAGLAFVITTAALIEAADDENDEDDDGSQSGP